MSKLSDQGAILSVQMTAKNTFKQGNEYNIGNKAAISPIGNAPDSAGNTGDKDDIAARNSMLVKNKYNSGNEYNLNNA